MFTSTVSESFSRSIQQHRDVGGQRSMVCLHREKEKASKERWQPNWEVAAQGKWCQPDRSPPREPASGSITVNNLQIPNLWIQHRAGAEARFPSGCFKLITIHNRANGDAPFLSDPGISQWACSLRDAPLAWLKLSELYCSLSSSYSILSSFSPFTVSNLHHGLKMLHTYSCSLYFILRRYFLQ